MQFRIGTASRPRCELTGGRMGRIIEASGKCVGSDSGRRARGRHRAWTILVAAVAALVMFPSASSAQSAIAGLVRDASSAVLPGVTVEASSPVLIEKTRTVIT